MFTHADDAQLGSSTAAGPAPSSAAAPGGSAFFEGERDRLLNEIAISLEVILSNSNALNRKLEESIAVGREFEPIAQLWGRFSSVMQTAGIPEYTGVGLGPSGAGGQAEGTSGASLVFGEGEGELGNAGTGANEEGGLRRSRGIEPGLPPGVAPGGGVIYGR
ncbi:hypothetical protein CF326_g3856 [Tilletia indica]|nr:hypothetical protein CF326_g3856 [Tilletia indica]